MDSIRFDINDPTLRSSFLATELPSALSRIKEETPALWGNMTSQHMLEHLMWAFQCSTGRLIVRTHTPDHLLERAKRFLYDNRPTPRGFRNPELGESPMPYQLPGFSAAQQALADELRHFLEYQPNTQDELQIHPVFGPLRKEEWERSHYKHCIHHLMQFGVITIMEPTKP